MFTCVYSVRGFSLDLLRYRQGAYDSERGPDDITSGTLGPWICMGVTVKVFTTTVMIGISNHVTKTLERTFKTA